MNKKQILEFLYNKKIYDNGGQYAAAGKQALSFMQNQGSDILAGVYASDAVKNDMSKRVGYNQDETGEFGYQDVENYKKGLKVDAWRGNLEGANAGFKAGSSYGPWGMAIGATAGGIAGTIAPYIGYKEKIKEIEESNQRAEGLAKLKFGTNFGIEEKGLYAFGGDITEFNEGGTHEQNPNGGIELGNNALVEQGETKFNNYIYSNRLSVDDKIADMFSLPKKVVGKTFSDASKTFSKESKERPNDPISLKSKEIMLNRLKDAHNYILKQEQQSKVMDVMQNGNKQMFATGGDGEYSISGRPDPNDPTRWIDDAPEGYKYPGTNDYIGNMLNEFELKRQRAENDNIAIQVTPTSELNEDQISISNTRGFDGFKSENPDTLPYKQFRQYGENKSETNTNVDYSKLGELAMYAPAIGNLWQYMNLEKPNAINLTRLRNKMGVYEVDEDFIARKIRDNANAGRAMLESNMGNNPSALLAGNVINNNTTNAGLSNAILSAEQENWNRKIQADQFNNAIDQVNLNQGNLEEDLNAREKGAYNTAKQQLFTDLMNSIGGIGKESWNRRTAKEYSESYLDFLRSKYGAENTIKQTEKLNAAYNPLSVSANNTSANPNVASTTGSPASQPNEPISLKITNSSSKNVEDINNLQTFLVQEGYLDKNTKGLGTGQYGKNTKAAVMKLQKELGITQTGEFDEATIKALNEKQSK